MESFDFTWILWDYIFGKMVWIPSILHESRMYCRVKIHYAIYWCGEFWIIMFARTSRHSVHLAIIAIIFTVWLWLIEVNLNFMKCECGEFLINRFHVLCNQMYVSATCVLWKQWFALPRHVVSLTTCQALRFTKPIKI